MPELRVRSIRVRPLQSADLCFNLSGVLSEHYLERAALGARAIPFDLNNALYKFLDQHDDDTGRLVYDSQKICDTLSAVSLFTVRNWALRASLDQLVASRQNAFLTLYKHADFVSAQFARIYADGTPDSKLTMFAKLAATENKRSDQIDTSYGDAEKAPTKTTSVVTNEGGITSTTMANPLSLETAGSGGPGSTTNIFDEATKNLLQRWEHQATRSNPQVLGPGVLAYNATDPPFTSQKTTAEHSRLKQVATSTEYRHPYLENQVRSLRTQLKLIEDQLPEVVFAKRVPHIKTILANELKQLDLEVQKLQLNLAHTFLVSPIPGVVTAIYKDIGESVQAGEPVARVENDETLLLLARVQSRQVLKLSTMATITTGDLFRAGQTLTLSGPIVAIRGHDSQNDEWEIVVRCPNSPDPDLRLPINYQYDRDHTTMTVS